MLKLNRRNLLRSLGGIGIGSALAACAPRVVTEVVKETVIVEGAVQVVEKEVTTVVEKIVEKEAAPKESVTVRFMTNDVGWRENRYRQLLPEFAYEYPHIRVEYTHVTGDWYTQLQTWAAAGTFPDVFYCRTNQTAPYARLGWIKPLTPFLDADPERDELIEDFWPTQIPQLKYKDEWYVIPENISSIGIKYRPEIWEAAGVAVPEMPWSFDQFREHARMLTKREGDKTAVWGFDPSWFLTSSGFAWMFLPAGIIDAENNKCIIDNPANAEMLNALQDMKFKDRVMPRTEDLPEGINLFASDILAMMPSGAWEVTDTRDSLGEDKHWDIALLPENPTKPGENLTICYGAGYALGKDAKSTEGAWTLCRYLSRPEMQDILIVEDNWTLPGRKSVADAWIEGVLNTGSGEPKSVHLWRDALERGRSLPVHAGALEVERLYANYMAPILTTGEKRAEEVLPQVQQEFQSVLDKYID
ncbi:MAG: ABC transporter substrate-binding protein [Anaerolineae bacterium]